jgi:hypothetical protein
MLYKYHGIFDCNRYHNELKSGEIYLTNRSVESIKLRNKHPWFCKLYFSERIGNISYDIYKREMIGYKPIFINKYEYFIRDILYWVIPTLVIIIGVPIALLFFLFSPKI